MPRSLDIHEKIVKIRDFNRHHRRPPSFSEMARLFGYASKNAVYAPVRRMIALGYLQRSAGGRVALTAKMVGHISVLGSVQAGFPSPAEEHLHDMINLDEFLVHRPEATYLLTVSGDSMQDAGIHDGDMVLVEKGAAPKPGAIVVGQVDGEWTIKYFGKDRTGIYLDPANAHYPRIRPEQALSIGGIVRAVIRKYA